MLRESDSACCGCIAAAMPPPRAVRVARGCARVSASLCDSLSQCVVGWKQAARACAVNKCCRACSPVLQLNLSGLRRRGYPILRAAQHWASRAIAGGQQRSPLLGISHKKDSISESSAVYSPKSVCLTRPYRSTAAPFSRKFERRLKNANGSRCFTRKCVYTDLVVVTRSRAS